MKTKQQLADQCQQRISEIRENIAHYTECSDWEMLGMNQQQLAYQLEQLKRYL